MTPSARTRALLRVELNANPEFKHFAFAVVQAVAQEHREFTADDVDYVLRQIEGAPQTHDARALGPVMLSAARAGLIAATNTLRNSSRESTHNSPRRVWRSLIWKPLEATVGLFDEATV